MLETVLFQKGPHFHASTGRALIEVPLEKPTNRSSALFAWPQHTVGPASSVALVVREPETGCMSIVLGPEVVVAPVFGIFVPLVGSLLAVRWFLAEIQLEHGLSRHLVFRNSHASTIEPHHFS